MVYDLVSAGRWEDSLHVCRFVKDRVLWSSLASMAIAGRHLDTAEAACAALDEVEVLEFVRHVKSIPSEEGRNAELALFRRSIAEAEAILLQAQPPLFERAININVQMFRWDRALELASQYAPDQVGRVKSLRG